MSGNGTMNKTTYMWYHKHLPTILDLKKIVIACKASEYEKHWDLVYLKAPQFGKNKNK